MGNENELISARNREERGSRASRRLRSQGEIPAHLSGLGMDPVDLAVPAPDFERVQRAGAQLITLVAGQAAASGERCCGEAHAQVR